MRYPSDQTPEGYLLASDYVASLDPSQEDFMRLTGARGYALQVCVDGYLSTWFGSAHHICRQIAFGAGFRWEVQERSDGYIHLAPLNRLERICYLGRCPKKSELDSPWGYYERMAKAQAAHGGSIYCRKSDNTSIWMRLMEDFTAQPNTDFWEWLRVRADGYDNLMMNTRPDLYNLFVRRFGPEFYDDPKSGGPCNTPPRKYMEQKNEIAEIRI